MTQLRLLLRRYRIAVMSVALAGVFVYAGVDKLRDPLQFADSIAAFAMLPTPLITPFALGLPIFEVLCGLLILVPPSRRVSALALSLANTMFLVALASALARGITLDCGCFGTGTPSRPRMWLEAALDVALLAASLSVYLRSTSPIEHTPRAETSIS